METIKLTTIQLDDVRVQVEGDDVDYAILMIWAEISQHHMNKNRKAMAQMRDDMLIYGSAVYMLEPDDDGIRMVNVPPADWMQAAV